jgi:hypothetical protein
VIKEIKVCFLLTWMDKPINLVNGDVDYDLEKIMNMKKGALPP